MSSDELFTPAEILDLKVRAEAGDAHAQLRLADGYILGQGLPKDPVEGYRLMRRAAEQGLAEAQSKVGYCFSLGVGVEADESEAVKWFEKGAAGGYGKAAYNLGDAYEKGRGVPAHAGTAFNWYMRAVELDYPDGHFGLYRVADKLQPRDAFHAIALYHLRLAARSGVREAFAEIRRLLFERALDAAEMEEVDEALVDAHGNGHPAALPILFALRRKRAFDPPRPAHLAAADEELERRRRLHAEPDPAEGLTDETLAALRRGADAGDPEACYRLGRLLDDHRREPRDPAEAFRLFSLAAGQGHAGAAFCAGVLLQFGSLGESDHVEALRFYRMAAERGHDRGASRVAELLRDGGTGLEADPEEAERWRERAALLGSPDNALWLGARYREGAGVPRDEAKALELLSASAATGFPPACGYLGFLRARGDFAGLPRDLAEGLLLLRLGGVGCDARAQFFAGYSLLRYGSPSDLPEAAYWLRCGAANGDGDAAYELAWLFREGRGVPRDIEASVAFFDQAVEEGVVAAATPLGRALILGTDCPRDTELAARTARWAATQGNADAATLLGCMYDDGVGVPKDGAQAVRWFRAAADRGDRNAPYFLATVLFDGRGVPPDAAEAFSRLEEAAAKGHRGAPHLLSLMLFRGEGTARDAARARRLFAEAQRARHLPSLFTTLEDESLRFRRAATKQRSLQAEVEDAAEAGLAGDAGAAFEAGLAIAFGEADVTQDVARGADLLRIAARAGHALAQACLAEVRRLQGDEEEALAWLRSAAAAGLPGAQRELALKVPDAEARRLLDAAADAGDPLACLELARRLRADEERSGADRSTRIRALLAFAAEWGLEPREESDPASQPN